MNAPEHKDEGSTKRTNFSLSGPLGGDFSFRLFGNLDKTQADARDINRAISPSVPGSMPILCRPGAKG